MCSSRRSPGQVHVSRSDIESNLLIGDEAFAASRAWMGPNRVRAARQGTTQRGIARLEAQRDANLPDAKQIRVETVRVGVVRTPGAVGQLCLRQLDQAGARPTKAVEARLERSAICEVADSFDRAVLALRVVSNLRGGHRRHRTVRHRAGWILETVAVHHLRRRWVAVILEGKADNLVEHGR